MTSRRPAPAPSASARIQPGVRPRCPARKGAGQAAGSSALNSNSRTGRATSVSARALAGPLPPRSDLAGGASLYPSVGGSLSPCTRVLLPDSAARVPSRRHEVAENRTGLRVGGIGGVQQPACPRSGSRAGRRRPAKPVSKFRGRLLGVSGGCVPSKFHPRLRRAGRWHRDDGPDNQTVSGLPKSASGTHYRVLPGGQIGSRSEGAKRAHAEADAGRFLVGTF